MIWLLKCWRLNWINKTFNYEAHKYHEFLYYEYIFQNQFLATQLF